MRALEKIMSCPFCHNPKATLSLRGASHWMGKLRYKCNQCGRTKHEQIYHPPTKATSEARPKAW